MDKIKEILEKAKVIAMVGLSPKEERASHMVAQYLLEKGYQVIPVNPGQSEILGQKCYASLREIPENIAIDIVDVFRKGEETPSIAREAVARKAKCLWLQLAITNAESQKIAVAANLFFVEDKCIKVEHQRSVF